jgi:hypothetical protein
MTSEAPEGASSTPTATASPSASGSPEPTSSPSLTGRESPLNEIEELMLGYGVTNVWDLPPEVLAQHGLGPDGKAL